MGHSDVLDEIWRNFDPRTLRSHATCPRDGGPVTATVRPDAAGGYLIVGSCKAEGCEWPFEADSSDDPWRIEGRPLRPWTSEDRLRIDADDRAGRPVHCPSDGTPLRIARGAHSDGEDVVFTCVRCGERWHQEIIDIDPPKGV